MSASKATKPLTVKGMKALDLNKWYERTVGFGDVDPVAGRAAAPEEGLYRPVCTGVQGGTFNGKPMLLVGLKWNSGFTRNLWIDAPHEQSKRPDLAAGNLYAVLVAAGISIEAIRKAADRATEGRELVKALSRLPGKEIRVYYYPAPEGSRQDETLPILDDETFNAIAGGEQDPPARRPIRVADEPLDDASETAEEGVETDEEIEADEDSEDSEDGEDEGNDDEDGDEDDDEAAAAAAAAAAKAAKAAKAKAKAATGKAPGKVRGQARIDV